MESALLLKFSELSLDDQRIYAPYKEDWVKMEEEEDPIRKDMLKDMMLQRIREGSKKISKMDKMRGRAPGKGKDRKVDPRVHKKSMDERRMRNKSAGEDDLF